MHKRIATTALAALFAAGTLFGALAKPASADADDHVRHAQHHHAYQNGYNGNHTGWNNGNGNTGAGSWVNGKYYPNGYTGNRTAWNGNRNAWNGNRNGWNRSDRDRDDRAKKHHKDRDDRR